MVTRASLNESRFRENVLVCRRRAGPREGLPKRGKKKGKKKNVSQYVMFCINRLYSTTHTHRDRSLALYNASHDQPMIHRRTTEPDAIGRDRTRCVPYYCRTDTARAATAVTYHAYHAVPMR